MHCVEGCLLEWLRSYNWGRQFDADAVAVAATAIAVVAVPNLNQVLWVFVWRSVKLKQDWFRQVFVDCYFKCLFCV